VIADHIVGTICPKWNEIHVVESLYLLQQLAAFRTL
jgi:hypothetical protein